jgi:hypothetical protein
MFKLVIPQVLPQLKYLIAHVQHHEFFIALRFLAEYPISASIIESTLKSSNEFATP